MMTWLGLGMLLLPWQSGLDSLLGPPPKEWVAPGRLFSLQIPPEWGVVLHEDDPYQYDFKPFNAGIDAVLRIQRVLVPPGASPQQMMLREEEVRKKKLPGYQTQLKQRTRVAGHKAATITARYIFQGNAQYPRFLQHTYIVVGEEAFVFAFECFEGIAGHVGPALKAFYDSFAPRPAGIHDDPFAVDSSTPAPTVDNLPF